MTPEFAEGLAKFAAASPPGMAQPADALSGAGANFTATRAASEAFRVVREKALSENRQVTAEEMAACEKVGFDALEAEQKEVAAENDADQDSILEHAYYCACCNAQRGVEDLPLGMAREAAATVRTHTVDFATWKRRLRYGAQNA